MSSTYSSGNVSSPFRVKNLAKFKTWCEDAGYELDERADGMVSIQPAEEGDWELSELNDGGEWADFRVELAKVLGEWLVPGTVVILYGAWFSSKQSTQSAGGEVTVIGSDGSVHSSTLTEIAAAMVAHYHPEAIAYTSGIFGEALNPDGTSAKEVEFKQEVMALPVGPGQQVYRVTIDETAETTYDMGEFAAPSPEEAYMKAYDKFCQVPRHELPHCVVENAAVATVTDDKGKETIINSAPDPDEVGEGEEDEEE